MFESAHLKIERANKHITELQRTIAEFIKSGIYNSGFKSDPQSGQTIVDYETARAPKGIPLIVGDTVHCLRASLDHAWNDIVKGATGKPTTESFPFDKVRETLIGRVDKAPIHTAYPKLRGVILDDIDPTEAGNKTLWSTNKLDNADKHRQLILAVSRTNVTLPTITGHIGDTQVYIGNNRVRGPSGIKGNFLKLTGNQPHRLHMENKGKATIEVIFGEGEFFEHQPVVPTLFQAHQLFAQALSSLDRACA